MKQSERSKIEGKIEMIDYFLGAFCKCEIPQEARLHLENLKYSLKLKINVSNRKINSVDK